MRSISVRRCSALKFETRPALGEERLRGLVCADRVLEVGRHRLVEEVEIDVVEIEPAQAGREADLRGIEAVVADPQLGGDEDLVARHAGAADTLGHLAFVAVGSGGVDHAIAVAQRRLDGGERLSGGLWKTPRPIAGIVRSLLSSRAVVIAGLIVLSVVWL